MGGGLLARDMRTIALAWLLAATCAGASLTLSWTDGSTNEQGFSIERLGDGGEWAEVGIVPADVTTFLDAGLDEGREYRYRVRAFNQYGYSAYTNEAAGTTGQAPGRPGDPSIAPEPVLRITVNDDGSITVEDI